MLLWVKPLCGSLWCDSRNHAQEVTSAGVWNNIYHQSLVFYVILVQPYSNIITSEYKIDLTITTFVWEKCCLIIALLPFACALLIG